MLKIKDNVDLKELEKFISVMLDNYFYNDKKYKNVKIDSKKDYVEMTCQNKNERTFLQILNEGDK